MSQADEAAKLKAVAEQLSKVSSEVKTLKDAAANATNVEPALQAAIDRVVGATQALDDMNVDALPVPEELG